MSVKYRLLANAVRTIPAGMHCDGNGLWLKKREDGGHQWVLRYRVNGKPDEMGLGGSHVTLKDARKISDEYMAIAKSGINPKDHKRKIGLKRLEQDNTLGRITELAFEAKKHSLKGEGASGRWLSPLTNHVLPALGKMPIDQLNQHDIKAVLSPIWHTKYATASKAISRLKIVFKHAAAMDVEVDLQAIEKAKLLLGDSSHVEEHIKFLPWPEVPAFYQSLSESSASHLALKLLILTGVRSASIRQMQTEQIQDSNWVISGASMKGPKGKTPDFRVPLSIEAKRIIDLALPFERNGYIFTGTQGMPISDATMPRIMQRMGMDERPHGFRTSIRIWLSEAEVCSYEVAETIMAHSVGNKVTKAYNRTDYLSLRGQALEKWSEYLLGERHYE
jgi:integrase|tara:strand:+ start:1186 stop:2355 length:1170 start_codon:yes stop_codon:yes gene_type:complete